MNNPYGVPTFGVPLFGQVRADPITGKPATPGVAPPGTPPGTPTAPTPPVAFDQMEAAGSFGDIGSSSHAGGAKGSSGGISSGLRGAIDSGFGTHAAAPNGYAVAQALGINPTLGGMVPGMLAGSVGSALNMVGNIANTVSNQNMLGSLGTSPSTLQTLGGVFGMNPLAGTYSGALSMAMGDKMPGFQGIEIAQAPGDYGAGYAAPNDTTVGGVMAGYGPGAVSQSDLAAPAGYGGSTGYGGGGEVAGGAGPSGNGNGNDANDNSGGGDPGGAASEAGFYRGGRVTQNRLRGPNPPGPDSGFGALKAGEFVLNNAAVRRLGLKKLTQMNRKGAN